MNHNEQRFPGSVIHESAVVYDSVKLGNNVYIGAGCVIGAPPEHKDHWGKENAGVYIGDNTRITSLVTVDSGIDSPTVIGPNCILLAHCHVGHDAYIGSNVTLSCHSIVGGHTVVMDYTNVGLGAIIHQKQKIEEGVMLGMGAIVTKKLKTEPYKTYFNDSSAKEQGENFRHQNYETYTINLKDTL